MMCDCSNPQQSNSGTPKNSCGCVKRCCCDCRCDVGLAEDTPYRLIGYSVLVDAVYDLAARVKALEKTVAYEEGLVDHLRGKEKDA